MTDPSIEIGGLRYPLGDRGPRCGIHGTDTSSGRCAACDRRAAARPSPVPVLRPIEGGETGLLARLSDLLLEGGARQRCADPGCDRCRGAGEIVVGSEGQTVPCTGPDDEEPRP